MSAVCSLQITGFDRRIIGGAIHTRGGGIVSVPVSEQGIDFPGDTCLGTSSISGFE